MSTEEEVWLDQVATWTRRDPDIRRYVYAVCAAHECADPQRLLVERPDMFEVMYETVEEMVEDVPVEEAFRPPLSGFPT